MKKSQWKSKEQKKCQGFEEKTKKEPDFWIEKAEQTVEILETQHRSNNLRFRGISEDFGRQNLEEKFRELLQDYLKIQGNCLDFDQIFRVNSKSAFMNQLPRDIFVRFSHKKTRDAILRKQRDLAFKVAEKEIKIFQDLPPSVLRKRKDFDFLTQILQEKEIRYQWKIPFAIEVDLPRGRKVIKTEEQAKLLVEELQAEDLNRRTKEKCLINPKVI
ncbi:uncharacterized protein LOC132584539 [Heteronotia binoei]|uniref:uncharacterized protein LOC132584539 n=1 Tax=Heteronotia binoei TaxID=13085 RepID=UPI00292E6624|nr:uncharacterized protein LOC132584539 [Heteronotia binoei]